MMPSTSPLAARLAPGSARLVSLEHHDDERANVIYLVAGTDAMFMVECVGRNPPEDDWLSIVESIEFLPAGE